MKVAELLRQLNLGNSVAEFDSNLENYFLETEVYDALEEGRIGIVAGDKGTGKTALYTILTKRFSSTQESQLPEVLVAFNPSGSPVFQKLLDHSIQTEAKYITIWKSYFFAICGNWLLSIYDATYSEELTTLDSLLRGLGLRNGSHQPEPTFTRILGRLENLLNWNSAEMEFEISADGAIKAKPRIEIGELKTKSADQKIDVDIDIALRHLDFCLKRLDKISWIAMDRLDEAFQGNTDVEIPALRGLFRSFLDMQELEFIKLKLFVRRDLFRRLTQGGFVNLTHINAMKREIIWDEEDLKSLLCKRVRENNDLIRELDLIDASDDQLFERLFPEQVDFGKRKPKTWVWMMRRIRDGNDVKPPRNLIDLVSFAIQTQIRSEARSPRNYEIGTPLIESESLRRGLSQLSSNRVTDTLLAEAKGYSDYIELFRRGKSEHNDVSISETISLSHGDIKPIIKGLTEMGFLERIKGNYKIPSLYRDGLEITQGKAFDTSSIDEDEEE